MATNNIFYLGIALAGCIGTLLAIFAVNSDRTKERVNLALWKYQLALFTGVMSNLVLVMFGIGLICIGDFIAEVNYHKSVWEYPEVGPIVIIISLMGIILFLISAFRIKFSLIKIYRNMKIAASTQIAR